MVQQQEVEGPRATEGRIGEVKGTGRQIEESMGKTRPAALCEKSVTTRGGCHVVLFHFVEVNLPMYLNRRLNVPSFICVIKLDEIKNNNDNTEKKRR